MRRCRPSATAKHLSLCVQCPSRVPRTDFSRVPAGRGPCNWCTRDQGRPAAFPFRQALPASSLCRSALRREKKGVVTGSGMQAGSGVCFLWLALVRRLCVGIVAGRSASVEIRAPGVTAARHSQRYKDCLGHEVIQWLAGYLLDSALQVHEAFSGIAEALPWREADCERVAVAPPVGKAGAMTQHEASGNFRESVIAFDVGFRKVRRKRSIERQFALINELEHPVRKDRLAQ